MVTLQTNYGDIGIELNHEKAPITCANFLEYCQSNFYENTLFHRVIDNFMIQGGGIVADEGNLIDKETLAPIKNEANNGLLNTTGTIAMARTAEPHSASSQFFINVSDNEFLNFRGESHDAWGYCVFGKVVQGMDVVNKIKSVKTGSRSMHQDVPVEDVIITGTVVTESEPCAETGK